MSRREHALALVRGPQEAMQEAVARGDVSINDIRAAREIKNRMTLSPIPWGKRDEALGKLVCRHVRDANPPIVIEYNPISTPRLVRYLRACGINH